MSYQKSEESMTSFIVVVGFIFALILCLTVTSFAQTGSRNNTANAAQNQVATPAVEQVKPTALQPVFTG